MPKLDGSPQKLIDVLTNSVKYAMQQGIFSKTINCLTQLKFEKTCIYPYPESLPVNEGETLIQVECNFVEFLNQLFTTVATIKALEYLKEKGEYADICLGTTSGRDLTLYNEKKEKITIAEIFAVTDPDSNDKLKNEIKSLAKGDGAAKYAFFILADDAFKKLNKKKTRERCWYQSWTNYTPKNRNNVEVQGEKIECNGKLSIDKNRATWSCSCECKGRPKNTINIVCWSSTYCLNDFSTAPADCVADHGTDRR